MKRNSGMKTKLKWMTGLTAVLVVMFLVVFSMKYGGKIEAADPNNGSGYEIHNQEGDMGTEHTMRRTEDTFSVYNVGGAQAPSSARWTSPDPSILGFGDGTQSIANSLSVPVRAGRPGTVELRVELFDQAGIAICDTIFFKVHVEFSINEYLAVGDSSPVKINRIFPEDERKAIVMDYGEGNANQQGIDEQHGNSIEFGDGTDFTKLNLTYGNALDPQTIWTVGNEDIITVKETEDSNGITRRLVAMGAGCTKLYVSCKQGGTEYHDEIDVYVRPRVRCEVNGQLEYMNNRDTIDPVSNGAILEVSTKEYFNPIVEVGDKLVWAIYRTNSNNTIDLVRDSLGNGKLKEEANLIYIPDEHGFKVNAKAGEYTVQFYIKQIYEKLYNNENQEIEGIEGIGCQPVNVPPGGLYVRSNYANKEVHININGTYDLSEAFNISRSILGNQGGIYFTITPEGDISDYIDINSTAVITTKKLGTVVLKVKPETDIAHLKIRSEIEGIGEVKVIITITDTFTMNITNTSMSVGGKLDLHGVLGSNTPTDASQYEWIIDDEFKNYLEIESINGKQAQIRAKQKTAQNQKVIVKLKYKSDDGIVLMAQCLISIDDSVTSFKIQPEKLNMKVGDTQTIETSIKGSTEIVWLSSDAKIATVEDVSSNTPLAKVTALKPGEVIITALNPANNVYATLVLTVEQPITELAVGIDGKALKTHTITLTTPYVFFEPIYEPKDATDKDFKWASSDTSVATVDETSGVVTVLKAGDTDISVSCKDHTGYCRLYVKTQGLTSITPDVTELEMIVGDTYTVKTELLPKDATNTQLKWESKDESVAKVEGGKITANGVGITYIDAEAVMAQDGKVAKMPTIKVNVRKGLQSIALDSNSYYVPMGGKKQVTVVYTPDDSSINKKVKYKSSNEAIFKVDDKGLITPVKEGMAMLTVTPDELGADGAVTAMVYVTSTEKAAKDFVISPEAAEIYIGDTLRLEKVFTPKDTTDQYVTWTSSDKSIATVNAAGIVTGVAAGETSITAVYNNTPDGKPWVRTSKIVVKPQPVHPTDFTVNPSTQNIKVNESFTLVPEFTPADTTNKNVEYQSLDEGVVKVDEKGKVTGVGAGDAIIQCQSEDGGFIATCAVHVENAVDFALSPAEKEIAVGRTFKITKIVSQANAKKTATWKSSNTAIATVDANGKVTAKRIGTCTITCKLSKYNQSASCKVKVRKLNSKVTLDKKNIRIGVGQTYKFKKTVWTNDTKNPAVLWRTSNKNVCSVNSFGKITGKKPGIVKITVMTKDAVHAKATCKVRVIQRVKSIRLNSDYMTLYVGRSKKLKATVNPKGATIKKLKFTSGDSKVARVMSSGKVRGISEGDTYITAKTTDGTNKKAKCFVKVLDLVPTSSIVVAQSDLTMKKGDRAKLTYTVLPDNTSDNLKFASDNERVVKVDKKGKVTAVGTGNAVVTILAESGVSTTVNINVVALNKTVLNMRQYDTETLIVQGTSSPITWYSENQRVASVENGKVLGRAIGSTNIYAYVNGCKLTCRVTITSVNS